MDKQRVNGAVDEVVGSAKRHFGNMTGNTTTQIKGAAQEIKGKVETAVGKLKDSARDAHNNRATEQPTETEVVSVPREVVITGDRNRM